MSTKTRSKRRRSGRVSVQKANGVLHPRVQKVGPQRLRDCLCRCGQGKVRLDALRLLRKGADRAQRSPAHAVRFRFGHRCNSGRRSASIASETKSSWWNAPGTIIFPSRRAFAAAGFETRIVHPFATKQFRQPADPGNKTDANDLAAMYRATVSGFGLLDRGTGRRIAKAQLLTRHRRDLVEKRSALCCQIREHLDAALARLCRDL